MDFDGFTTPSLRARRFRAAVLLGCISAAAVVVGLAALGLFA